MGEVEKLPIGPGIEVSKRRIFQGALVTFAIGSFAVGLLGVIHATGGGPADSWTWFPVPVLSMLSTGIIEDPNAAFEVTQAIADLVYLFGVLLYYLLGGVALGGVVFLGIGILGMVTEVVQDDLHRIRGFGSYVVRHAGAAVLNLRVLGGLLLGGAIGLEITQRTGVGVLELLGVILVIGLGWIVLGGATLLVFWRFRRVDTDLLLVIPLTLLAICLPILVAGLLSPTLQPSTVGFNAAVMDWIIGETQIVENLPKASGFSLGKGTKIVLFWSVILWITGGAVGSVMYIFETIENKFGY